MNSTLRDWRQALRLTCVCASLLIAPSLVRAQADSGDHAKQEVDAASKQLMAANGLFQRGLFKLAADEYANFLQINPNHAQASAAHYALGVCRLRLEQYDKAIEAIEPVSHEGGFAQRDEALAVLGYCQLMTRQYDKANSAFGELISHFPQSKQIESAECYRVQALYLGGKFADAANYAESFLRDHASSDKRPTTLYFLALSEHAQNQHEQVLATLDKLDREKADTPYKVDSLLLAGQSLEATGKLDAAIERYRQMASIAPESRRPDAHYSLGVALYKAGKYNEAARELASVCDNYPKSNYAAPAKLEEGLAELADHQIDKARRTLEAVARDDTARAADARYGLAQCDIAQKKFESARAMLDTLAFLQPAPANLPQILLDRAVCLMELGKFEQAAGELDSLQSAHAQSPQVPEAIYRRAFCLHKLKDYAKSHDLCQRLAGMSKSPVTAPAAELDAENLFLLNKYADAKNAFGKLAQESSDQQKKLRYTLRVGQCDYLAGNYAAATEALKPMASDSAVQQSDELRPAIFLYADALLQQGKNAEAIPAFEQYLAWAPRQGSGQAKSDQSEAQFKLGHAQIATSDIKGARKTLAQLTQGSAESPWVQRGLLEYGQLLYKAKEGDQSASMLSRLVSANPPAQLAAPALYLLGWVDFDAKRYEQAADQWKKLIDQYGKEPLAIDAAYQRGVALKEAKQNDQALEALDAFASAHRDHPNYASARQLSASILAAQGKHEQAEKILAELGSDSKASDGVLYDLAWARRNLKNFPAAQETYRRLLSLHPDSKLAPAARTELAELLYNGKKYSEAADLLDQVVHEKSADAKVIGPATYRLGFCQEKLKQWDKAAGTFTDFSDHFGQDAKLDASALVEAGVAYSEEGKYDRAESVLSRMLEKHGDSEQAPVAMLKLGQAQAERQEFDASLRTNRQFLERFAKSEYAYLAQFGIGWSEENLKQYGPARDDYKKVLAMTNGQTAARAQFQIGESYLAEQKFEQGIAALLAVEDVYAYPTWSARALLEAGRAFEQLKQPARAKQQYTQLINKYKNAPEAEVAQQRMRDL